MLLAGRVRKPEEASTIQNILEKHFKRTINPEALFSEAQVTTQFSEFSPGHTFAHLNRPGLPSEVTSHVVDPSRFVLKSFQFKHSMLPKCGRQRGAFQRGGNKPSRNNRAVFKKRKILVLVHFSTTGVILLSEYHYDLMVPIYG